MQSSHVYGLGRVSAADQRSPDGLTGAHRALLDVLSFPSALLSGGRVAANNGKLSQLLVASGLVSDPEFVESLLAPVSRQLWNKVLLTARARGVALGQRELRFSNGMPFCRDVLLSVIRSEQASPELILAQFLPEEAHRAEALAKRTAPPAPSGSDAPSHATLISSLADEVFAFDPRMDTDTFRKCLSRIVGREIDPASIDRASTACRSNGSAFVHLPEHLPDSEIAFLSGRKVTEVRFSSIPQLPGAEMEPRFAVVRKKVDCPAEAAENRVNAFRDPLTGLANRRAFMVSLERELKAVADPEHPGLAIIYVDLNEFKVVNDLGGHRTGDDMLWRVSAGLALTVGDRAATARLGGDEFAALVAAESREAALDVGGRIKEALARIRMAAKDRVFTIGGSIGVAHIEGGSDFRQVDAERILAQADDVCLSQKRLGDPSVGLRILSPDDLETEQVQTALAPGPTKFDVREYVIREVPIWCMDRQIAWGSDIQPARVFGGCLSKDGAWRPIAERAGILGQIDSLVLEKTVGRLEANPVADAIHTVRVSISSASDPGFRDYLKYVLSDASGLAERICLKITECEFLRAPSVAEAFFRTVRDLGGQTAIDDFAGHWPVLSRLCHLPVDWIKLDAGLVQEAAASQSAGSILKGMVHSVLELGVKVAAKDVRNADQAELLSSLKVSAVQGPFAGEPKIWEPDVTPGI